MFSKKLTIKWLVLLIPYFLITHESTKDNSVAIKIDKPSFLEESFKHNLIKPKALIKEPDPPSNSDPPNLSDQQEISVSTDPILENLISFNVEEETLLVLNQSPPTPNLAAKPNSFGPNFEPKRLALSYVKGSNKNIIYGTDYAQLDILSAPDYHPGSILPMIDLRVENFNYDTWGASLGIIARNIPNSCSPILGVNAYYDYRQGSLGNFNQLGFGIEILGKRVDLRANTYIPIGKYKHKLTCCFDDYDGNFFFAINRKHQLAAVGGNVELGYYPVKSDRFSLYTAAGPYFFAGKFNDMVVGGEIRMRPQYRDYFAIDLGMSYDRIFKTNYQFQIIFSVPLYEFFSLKNKKGACSMTNRQIYQPVIRYVPMLKKRSCWEDNFDEPFPQPEFTD